MNETHTPSASAPIPVSLEELNSIAAGAPTTTAVSAPPASGPKHAPPIAIIAILIGL